MFIFMRAYRFRLFVLTTLVPSFKTEFMTLRYIVLSACDHHTEWSPFECAVYELSSAFYAGTFQEPIV